MATCQDCLKDAEQSRPAEVASRAAAAAMRSLPRDVTSFTGRQRELEQLAKAGPQPA